MKFGERLRELREERGYTQEQLANILHTSRSRIGMYEKGMREPDFEMQEAIADLFNVNLDYLIGRKNDVPEFDPEMLTLIEIYSKCNDENKDHILAYARALMALNK